MKKISLILVYYLIRMAGLLPIRVLYILSDIIYILGYHILGYRKNVVFENLKNSFPEKNPAGIKYLAKGFYRHLSDLIVETIYQSGMGEEEIKKRVRYNNYEVIEKYFQEGKHVAAVLGHYCNWEWLCSFPLITQYKCITIYRELKNKMFDKLIFDMRSRFGAEPAPMKMAIRKIYEYDQQGKPTITAFLADQAPPRGKAIYWIDFLNQDTPVYLGTERIAKKMNMAVVYFKMNKIRRGYYEFDIIPLFDNSTETSDYEITNAHVAQLEKLIIDKPEYWLWSHRRWKIKRRIE